MTEPRIDSRNWTGYDPAPPSPPRSYYPLRRLPHDPLALPLALVGAVIAFAWLRGTEALIAGPDFLIDEPAGLGLLVLIGPALLIYALIRWGTRPRSFSRRAACWAAVIVPMAAGGGYAWTGASDHLNAAHTAQVRAQIVSIQRWRRWTDHISVVVQLADGRRAYAAHVPTPLVGVGSCLTVEPWFGAHGFTWLHIVAAAPAMRRAVAPADCFSAKPLDAL